MRKASQESLGIEIESISWRYAQVDVTVTKNTNADNLAELTRVLMDKLEEREDDLKVLERHNISVMTPGSSDTLVTQGQFDCYKGFEVEVQTEDPFKSNRLLVGTLIGRDAINVRISGNKKGQVITIPHEMIKSVKLPKAKKE